MKSRFIIFAMPLLFLLSSCSLAEDITPPPGYQMPSPAPTLSLVFPATPPNLGSGAVIYAEECAPCHGESGLGDGPLAAKLEKKPANLAGLAQTVKPAAWYAIVTEGRMQNFMPPFSNKLSDQQRWEVVAYTLLLSVTSDEIAAGQSSYETSCAQCHGADGKQISDANLANQALMVNLSQKDLVDSIQKGVQPKMPATDLMDPDAYALAAYVRTFTFPAATMAPVPETTPTPEKTPEVVDSTPIEAVPTDVSAAAPQGAVFTGTVVNASGSPLPADLTVTLRGFDHDASGGSFIEASSQAGKISEGAFSFQGIETAPGRIYVAEVQYGEVPYQSAPIIVDNAQAVFAFEPLSVYETTTDFNLLKIEQVHYFFDAPANGKIPVSALYVITNQADRAILVESDGSSISFITVPAQAENIAYQDAGMGGAFIPTPSGFLIPPSDSQYGLVASFSLPYEKQLAYEQSFQLNVSKLSVIVPEGMQVKGEGFRAGQLSQMGQGGGNFQPYSATPVSQGVAFTLTGSPKPATPTVTGTDTTKNIILGVGVFGAVLILIGGLLFWRDRRQVEADDELEDEDAESGDEDTDDILDAILTLDDQFKAGNLPEEAYQERRAELKEKLKNRS